MKDFGSEKRFEEDVRMTSGPQTGPTQIKRGVGNEQGRD